MKLTRFATLFALALSTTAGLTACSGSPPASGTNAASPDKLADSASPAHDHFLMMTKDLDLSDAQKTQLRAVSDEFKAKGVDVGNARTELMLAVAAGVENNNLDAPEISAKIQALTDAVAKHQGDIAASMNKMHDLLTPAQRQKVADRVAHMGGPRGEHGEPGEHAVHADKAEGRHFGRSGGMKEARELADKLELTADQRQHVRDALKASFAQHEGQAGDWKAKGEALKAKAKKISEAFAQDKFDAVALGVGDNAADMAKKMATGKIEMAKVLNKELTPEQRTKFAADIRDRANPAKF